MLGTSPSDPRSKMNSRIPPRPVSTPSPLVGSSLDDGLFSERGSIERNSGSVMLRSSVPTPPKSRTEGEIEKVKVFARIRPALREDETPGALVWSEDNGQLTIFRPDAPVPQSDFAFDKVLGPNSSQADVYHVAVSDVVADVLRGYNGTILAYGQTGAGKTYTLGNTAPDAIGMIPRAAAELFSAATRDPMHMYRITMSYIQIYMEMIQDLLNPTADNLPIREDAGGVFVAGACEVPVTSLEECLHYLELGEQNRVFAFTHLNAHSSRSHAVVMLTVVKSRKYLTDEERAQAEAPDQDGVVTQKVTVGKLYMVDLAGSERLKKSKSVGLRATEARSINLSLTMLGMCISARAQDSQHVPFRDSKLTRLLQESLGGNAKTSLILCLSDVRQHADESLQSLQFGARAARVCNKPVVNERLQMRQLTAELLAALEEGNERTNGLEAALSQTKEERDALQAALARERARSAAIVEALRAEARAKDEQAAAKLAEQAELLSEHVQQLGQVQQQQGQLEMEVARLKEEQRVREEAHRTELAELQQQLAAVQAAATAERLAIEAEARSQQVRLATAAQQHAAALSSQLAQERGAAREQAASIHLALTRLQRALGELVSGPAPAEDNSGKVGAAHPSDGAADNVGRRASGGGAAPRPAWAAGLAAAAAAAVSRRGASVSSGGDCSLGGAGGSAVQLIQAALGLTGAPSDGNSDDNSPPPPPAPVARGGESSAGAAGRTAAAVAALFSGGSDSTVDSARRLRGSQSLGSAASSLLDQRLGVQMNQENGAETTAGPVPAAGVAANARQLRATHSASSMAITQASLGAPPTPTPRTPPNQQPAQQQWPHQDAVRLAGAGAGACSRSAAASLNLTSSEIADIDAALVAAQQDLLADLRAVAAASGSVPGHGSGQGTMPPSWPGTSHPYGLTWPLPASSATTVAVAVAGDASQSGAASSMPVPSDVAAAARQPALNGKSYAGANASGAARGNGASYAGDYAIALQNGLTSPGRAHRTYSQLHGVAVHTAAMKQLRPYANGMGEGTSDGSLGGALQDDASGHSSTSVSMPCPPTVGPGGTRGGSTTPTASIGTDDYTVSHSQSQGDSMSTPFMDDRGLRAATAASPSPTSKGTNAAAGAAGGVGMQLGHSTLNVNPAFDTCDSEGLKSEDLLATMGVGSLTFKAQAGAMDGDDAAVPQGQPALPDGVMSEPLSNASLMAPPTAVAAPPPLPMFAGIQVQLNALLDMTTVLRRLKTGLEARVLAQACELARRQQEQQRLDVQSRGDLQASRAALADAESQLGNITQELDAVRLVLAETLDELEHTRRQLQDCNAELDEMRFKLEEKEGVYDSTLDRLGETRGRLDEARAELEAGRREVARLRAELEQAKADLDVQRAALVRSQAASARSQAVTTQALAARHELQRQVRAANTIKRAFKAFKLLQLRAQVAAKHRALAEAETARQQREALQAARAGQALVQESMGVMRDAVGAILAAFVGRRHQLEARKSLHERMERMMSQGGSASKGGAHPSTGAPPRLALPGIPQAGAAGALASGPAFASARSTTMLPPPATPGRAARQMSSPLGLSMMLAAVTLPPPKTPTSVSTNASVTRLVTSADGAGATASTGGAAGAGHRQRPSLVPVPMELTDDTGASAVSSVAPKGVVGVSDSSNSAAGIVNRSGGAEALVSAARGLDGSVGGRGVAAGTGTGDAADVSPSGGRQHKGSGEGVDAREPASLLANDCGISPATDSGGPCSSSNSCSGAVTARPPVLSTAADEEEAEAWVGPAADAVSPAADAILPAADAVSPAADAY